MGGLLGGLVGLPNLGALIGAFIGDFAATAIIEYLEKKQESNYILSLEEYEAQKITAEEKRIFYIKCLREISLPPIENISVTEIREATRNLYHQNNPDRHKDDPNLALYEEKFVHVNNSYKYIQKYRRELGTWTEL